MPATERPIRAGLAIAAWCPAQVAAVGGIADQRFVAARELFAEPGDDRLPHVALAFRLGLVAAQDVARRTKLDLLDEELGFAARTIDEQRRQGLLVLEHKTADDGGAALAGAREYIPACALPAP